ncbi:MAG: zinc ribbon domain-containing protein [Candidatus Heimdallarchaeaceae archaeon]
MVKYNIFLAAIFPLFSLNKEFIKLLKYKAAEHGIVVDRIEEQYTSKCSFLS